MHHKKLNSSNLIATLQNVELTITSSNQCNRDLQNAEIARIVKTSPCEVGGIPGIAKASDTDLEKGLSCDKDDLCSRCVTSLESETQPPHKRFFQILWTACNKYMVILLLLCSILSLAFGIEEEGWKTGWFEGAFIINALIILVAIPIIREYWYFCNLSGSKNLSKKREISVDVVRRGIQNPISIPNVLLFDDIQCLKTGDQIPANGLFISGESLELDEELLSIIDGKKSVTFYGAIVISGNCRMLVTTIGKDTCWDEMMSNVTNAPTKKTLQGQLDRLNACTQIAGIVIFILYYVVEFLRIKFEKNSNRSGLPDLKAKSATTGEFIDAIKKFVMKPSGKTSILASLLTFLVGITEGLPLTAALTSSYWNKKAMSVKGPVQDFLACINMGSVTTICTDKTCGLTLNQIKACIQAGVNIKLLSGCGKPVLETIALACGLNMPNSNSGVLGEDFRNSTQEEMTANSQPTDKFLQVKCFKENGHIVAMIGVRTDAIKEVDEGITLGKCGTAIARESSNITVSDGDCDFLVTVLKYGRCAYENIQKFIQLELTATISWLLTNLIMTICFGDDPLTAIQFIWVCFIMVVPGGLALLTEPPTEKLMKKSPVRRTDSVITRNMWRNIVPQAIYQVAILVLFQFKGQSVLGISQKVSDTMIFNSFVLCQVFNLFTARELEKKNVFKGIHQHRFFLPAVVVTLALQEGYTEIAHFVAKSARLNLKQWALCFLIGVVSWVVDWAAKCASDFRFHCR